MKKRAFPLFFIIFFVFNSVFSQKYTGLSKGYIAPNIKLKNIKGKKEPLNNLDGKLVLIYFWASWSEHCRAENKELVKILNEYKNKDFKGGKGFAIYAIALEKNEPEWFSAINQDELSGFVNVSELKFMNSKVAEQYNIKLIPMTFLIDGEGIILDKGINPEGLRNKLSELQIETTRIIK